MDSDLAIKTDGLTKFYRKSFWRRAPEPALEGLTLNVPRECVFGFLGPNGAGKTTTIRCLMDLIRPTKGNAWVLGKPCSNIAVREKIGYLPDSPAFGSHMSAVQFLKTCCRLLKIKEPEAKTKIEEVLDIVRMTKHRNQQLAGFSRGMLQRIGIAQALLNDPELLILDEPLVGLDPVGRRELLDIVRGRKQAGVCIFFCSHILSDVESLCDQVGILNNGKLMVAGEMSKLLKAKGRTLSIPAKYDEFARKAMMSADNSHRGDDGSWVLEFENDDAVNKLNGDMPDDVKCFDRRERLEDLFFRMTKDSDGSETEAKETEDSEAEKQETEDSETEKQETGE